MPTTNAPYTISPGEASAVWTTNKRASILATSSKTNSAFSMIYERYHLAGKQIPLWLEQDVTFYILKGSIAVSRSSKVEGLRPGDVIFIPRLTTFQVDICEVDTEILVIYTPGGPEELEMLLWPPALSGYQPPDDIQPPPPEYSVSLAKRYGVHLMPDVDIATIPATTQSPHQLSIQPRPFKTNAATAPAFWVKPQVPELWTVLLSALQTNNVFTLTEISFAKGHAAGPLKYQYNDEAYFILSGNASIMLNSRYEKVDPGDFVFIPRGTVFGVDSESDDFVALTLHTPSGIIEGALPLLGGVPATERKLPKDGDLPAREPPSSDDMERLGAQMRILGIDAIKARAA